MNFYTIKVFNGKEKSITEKIKHSLKLNKVENLVKQIITPKEKFLQIRKGKKVFVDKLYFPGYIFIETVMTDEVISAINNVDGVYNILGSNKPIPMSEKEVANLLIKQKNNDIKTDYTKYFKIGESVKIIDSPFSNMIGKIKKINYDKKTVIVIVKIFNRETPVDLKFNQIVKI